MLDKWSWLQASRVSTWLGVLTLHRQFRDLSGSEPPAPPPLPSPPPALVSSPWLRTQLQESTATKQSRASPLCLAGGVGGGRPRTVRAELETPERTSLRWGLGWLSAHRFPPHILFPGAFGLQRTARCLAWMPR